MSTISRAVQNYMHSIAAWYEAQHKFKAEIGETLKDSPEWQSGKPLEECMSEAQATELCLKHFGSLDAMENPPHDAELEQELARLADQGVEWACQAQRALTTIKSVATLDDKELEVLYTEMADEDLRH